MPKVNVYLPGGLAAAVREAGIAVSPVCQRALEKEVRRLKVKTSIGEDKLRAAAARLKGESDGRDDEKRQEGYEVGQRWALEEASPEDLEALDDPDSSRAHMWPVEVEGEELRLDLMAGDPWADGFYEGACHAWGKLRERVD
ncbi:MAG: hypothetical protein QOK40_403 [Miltoncostaeaceae bacterium]|nr:hypothetical protein [Miltoncostaeaceae bacterium]